jgi:Cap4 SAVED domain
MDFEVIIDSSLVDLALTEGLNPSNNKWLLSIINDFEDGKWRAQRFDNFVWDNIEQTALTYKEREALQGKHHTLLIESARNLRLTDAEDDIGTGSELAEIVLYGIMRQKYRALSVVPKIFHKQNSQDNAKGADSVHIVIDSSGDFTLWLGEAKFYNSIENTRLSNIVQSVKNALDTEKLKKENSIIVNIQELDYLSIDAALRTKIKQFLSSNVSIDTIKPKLNIPILLLHECPTTAGAKEVTPEYRVEIEKRHKERATAYFKKQIEALKDVFKYPEVRFHLILFPVPEKKPIIERFVNTVKFYKPQAPES